MESKRYQISNITEEAIKDFNEFYNNWDEKIELKQQVRRMIRTLWIKAFNDGAMYISVQMAMEKLNHIGECLDELKKLRDNDE